MSVRRLPKEKGEAISQSKSRIEQVLLVGLQNKRTEPVISPSKPIGLFGGVQRKENHKSTHLLETVLQLRMYAVTESSRLNRNGDRAPFYDPAPSFDKAQGIYAIISMGCFYRPDNNKNQDDMKNIALVGLRDASATARNLFVQSFRSTELGWHQLAEKLDNSLIERFDENNPNPPQAKIEAKAAKPETNPDAHLLTPEEAMDAELAESNRINKLTIYGAAAEASAWTYLKFDERMNFNITNPHDEALVYAFPVEFEKYSSALFDKLQQSDIKFGTVCQKGTQIELSFEQNADDVLYTKENETDASSSPALSMMDMFANM